MTSPRIPEAQLGPVALAARLRELAPGTIEWRVADPVTGAYCLAFSGHDCGDPEGKCRQWLEEHVRDFPKSVHANKVVTRVHFFTPLERAALRAAELLDQPTAGQEDTRRMDWLAEQDVTVRIPARYGSRFAFAAHAHDDEEDGVTPSALRELVDTRMTAAPASSALTAEPETFEIDDLAHSAFDEAMSFGVSVDLFKRYFKGIIQKLVAGQVPVGDGR